MISSLFPHLKDLEPKSFKSKDFTQGSHPLKVGIVLSGGPAPGGHTVIAGVFEALKKVHPDSELIGFLDGPSGIIHNKSVVVDGVLVEKFRHQGGFQMLGTGRTKIETEEQFENSLKTAVSHHLNGLIIVGGDDSNTNAAHLAEYFLAHDASIGTPISVVGVPKTIDGDLKNDWVEASFGFDTAAKTYAAAIGNIAYDALSQKKYYFFIKVMGRTASHLVLECALQTRPNLALISEEVEEKKLSLQQVIASIADLIVERSKKGKDYGMILIPEGLIEFIADMKLLLLDLKTSSELFQSLPKQIQDQLLLEKDPHGNVQVSKIETERLFIALVEKELKQRSDYKGKFSPQPLFFGYEGRSCTPSTFDDNYCFALGLTAVMLIQNQATGYMAVVRNLAKPLSEWTLHGAPLVGMMELVEKKGKQIAVIKKGLVALEGKPFGEFKLLREGWRLEDNYLSPGPIQFGDDSITKTLALEWL
jgi:diphosphate-dependent phosphofructokinase